jgi:cell division protein FtsB
MPNGGFHGEHDRYRSREETVGACDVVIAAEKALKKMDEQEKEIKALRKEVDKLEKKNKKLRSTISTLRSLDKE